MPVLEILDGLSPYDEVAVPFPPDPRGTFREGLVVRFHDSSGGPWVGNFKRRAGGLDLAEPRPDQRHVLVVAGGDGYLVDPATRALAKTFGWMIDQMPRPESANLLLLANPTNIYVFTATHDWISKSGILGWTPETDRRGDGVARGRVGRVHRDLATIQPRPRDRCFDRRRLLSWRR